MIEKEFCASIGRALLQHARGDGRWVLWGARINGPEEEKLSEDEYLHGCRVGDTVYGYYEGLVETQLVAFVSTRGVAYFATDFEGSSSPSLAIIDSDYYKTQGECLEAISKGLQDGIGKLGVQLQFVAR